MHISFLILEIIFQFVSCNDLGYLYKYNEIYYSDKYEVRRQYTFKNFTEKFKCEDAFVDCAGNGSCDTETTCACNIGYYSIPGSYVKCTYKQKKLSTALLLESLIGFGFGHMYRGNFVFFVGKFLFYFFTCYFYFCIIICVGALNNSNVDEKTYYYTKRSSIIIIPLMIGWYLLDVIMFLLGRYGDANGMPLY